MLLLALDTAGASVTVAVHDGRRVLAEHPPDDGGTGRRHAEELVPAIAAVLARAGADRRDLTAVAVGVGPGPFTGLRVGVVTARVLGGVLGVPVHGVCSLDALAEAACATGAHLPEEFTVALDARRREVHWAGYRRVGEAGWRRADGPAVAAPADVPRGSSPVVGRGALLYPAELGPPVPGVPLDVGAGALAAVAVRALEAGGPDGDLLPPDPLYLRRPDAAVPGERKRVLR